jgi:hypothetical protein
MSNRKLHTYLANSARFFWFVNWISFNISFDFIFQVGASLRFKHFLFWLVNS